MKSNRLRLNPTKSEFIWSRLHLVDTTIPFIGYVDALSPAESVKNLVAYFGANMRRSINDAYTYLW